MNRSTVLILGAGPPYRGSAPSALIPMRGGGRVLDWIMQAFAGAVDADFQFVGGYRFEEVLREYPDIRFSVNPQWESSGSLGSLLSAPLTPGRDTYVCYADIVFRREAVEKARDATGFAVAVVDRKWRTRYPSRPAADLACAEKVQLQADSVAAIGAALPAERADAEYVGLARLSPAATEAVIALQARATPERRLLGIPELLASFVAAGLDVRGVDIAGAWAELNAPPDLARFVLGTKAETLGRLRPLLRSGRIAEIFLFSVDEWQRAPARVLRAVQARFGPTQLIVRSSAAAEDGWTASRAGEASSVMNVPGGDSAQLAEAVAKVIASYGPASGGDQVLVQPMLTDVCASGVGMTRTLNRGAPYYVLNFDDQSGRTDTVTSGASAALRTVILHRSRVEEATPIEGPLGRVARALREVEDLLGHDALDVEFALSRGDQVHLFQVRPIVLERSNQIPDADVERVVEVAERTFASLQQPSATLLGRQAVFAVMPDWNPAEIIGTRPRRLAWSLYRYLVTDDVWARQRAEYGYRDVRPQPLMVSFGGQPYIDVRASFNSFIPAAISDSLAERLVDHYLERLLEAPHLQDKVEFEIVFTCRPFDFSEQVAACLAARGFGAADIDELDTALGTITRAAVERSDGDMLEIDRLAARYPRLARADLPPIQRAHALLEDCRRFGTLPFAHLARTAFVATTLLRSLERMGILSRRQSDEFLGSVYTVTQRFEADASLVAAGVMAWDAFVEEYGHLRPGTYEITSASYRDDPERFLRPLLRSSRGRERGESAGEVWDGATRAGIASVLEEARVPGGVEHFVTFLRSAIEAREKAKFVFTRNLSSALDALAEFGAEHGIAREDLSYVGIDDLLAFRVGSPCGDPAAWLRGRVDEGKGWHELMQMVELPPLIRRAECFRVFERPAWQPNFVGDGRIVGDAVDLAAGDGGAMPPDSLRGRIVLIPQADPGYDWLFGHGIVGMITMYGGANSHMAVRAAELRLPAAIGVGESLYEQLAGAQQIELDCGGRRIRVLR